MTQAQGPRRRTDRPRHQRRRPLDRQAARRRAPDRADPQERHAPLGAGHGEPEPALLRRGLRGREPLRPDGGAAVVRRVHRHEPRRGPGDPGRDPRPAHDLRRRRVVVLRRPDRAGRRDHPRPHAVRLQGRRDEVLRARRCSRAATRPTSTSAARCCASSAPPRCATWPRTRASSACSRTTCRAPGRDQELEDLEKQKLEYYQSFLDLGHEKRLFVKVGDKLADAADRPAHDRDVHHRVALVPDDGLGRDRASTARARTHDGGLAARDVARPRRARRSTRPTPTGSTRARRAATCRRAMRS